MSKTGCAIASELPDSYYSWLSRNWLCLYTFITPSSPFQPICATHVGWMSMCYVSKGRLLCIYYINTIIRLQSSLLELTACSRAALVKTNPSKPQSTSSNFWFLLEVLHLAACCMITLCFLYSQQSSIVTCRGWFTLFHIWIVLQSSLSYLKGNYLPKLSDPASALGGRNWS